jgi:hypothetical protein
MRLKVALRAHAGDLGRHAEQRMRYLTGDHVDLVVKRHGDQHVGAVGACLRQRVGVGAVADETAHVERVADDLDEVRRCIDDGDVVLFGGEPFGDAVADLAGAADHHPHSCPPSGR